MMQLILAGRIIKRNISIPHTIYNICMCISNQQGLVSGPPVVLAPERSPVLS